jgi:DNA-binding response OmpR family regulator
MIGGSGGDPPQSGIRSMDMAKILVVDDDADTVEAIRIVLESAGHQVVSAGTRAQGMAALDGNPDLVILDVMMEEQDDGITLAQWARKRGIQTPILMLSSISKVTGYRFDRDEEIVPVDLFEEKPINPKHLLDRVEGLLRGKGA